MENDELQEKLDEVLDQKNKYILPENIKKDITILGVTGTVDFSPLSEDEYTEAIALTNDILGIEEE